MATAFTDWGITDRGLHRKRGVGSGISYRVSENRNSAVHTIIAEASVRPSGASVPSLSIQNISLFPNRSNLLHTDGATQSISITDIEEKYYHCVQLLNDVTIQV